MKRSKRALQQSGFTIMQMVVTIAIIAVVSTFGVLGIRQARAEFRLQNSARTLASYLEKARADAVRRHADDGNKSSVESFGPETNTYAVTMDFGNGTLETRMFQFEPGITFDTIAQKTSFNWRGRIVERQVYQITNGTKSIPVDVSGSGDVTIGEQRFPDNLIPAVEIAAVTGDVIVDATPTPTPTPTPNEGSPPNPDGEPSSTPTPTPTPTPNGNGNGNGGNGNGGNGNPHASPTPTPQPTPTPTPSSNPTPTPTPLPPCVATLSQPILELSQTDPNKKSGTVTLTIANAFEARTITATQAGSGNSLVISLSQARIQGNGTSIITVTTKNGAGNRGDFLVNVSASPTCGSTQQLTVKVSN